MEKPKGMLPNKIKFTDGVYVNNQEYDGMYIHYGLKGLGGRPWIWGVVEYLGEYYNLDDLYDRYRCFLALIYTGVIRKANDRYAVIDPEIVNNPFFRIHTGFQELTLMANLQGRCLRVLNQEELDEYNQHA